jgi:putative redox protein
MAELELTARWEGGFKMVTAARGFTIRSDEPTEYRGENTGPTPTELLLTALASCLGMAMIHAAGKRGLELPDLSVTVTGTYDGPRFARIAIRVTSSHPHEELAALLERAVRTCYVSNTLKNPPELDFVAGN